VAEEQRQLAEEANEAKSLFIANISHELRTPLTGVLNMCEVAMDEAQGQPNIQKSLEVATLSGKALFRLITELLTFSRNEVGGIGEKVEETEFEMPELATQLRIFEKLAKEKSIDLTIDISPKEELQDMLFLGDRHKLSQVLINLVSNSMKFTQYVQLHIRAKNSADSFVETMGMFEYI
jgi:osomolarity two-component system sensor histidine kinase SLN1